MLDCTVMGIPPPIILVTVDLGSNPPPAVTVTRILGEAPVSPPSRGLLHYGSGPDLAFPVGQGRRGQGRQRCLPLLLMLNQSSTRLMSRNLVPLGIISRKFALQPVSVGDVG